MAAKKQANEPTDSTVTAAPSTSRARRKKYEVPDSVRLAVTLDKRQLKEFKKIGVEFEMPDNEVLQLAVEMMINKFQKMSTTELDERGREALFD